MRIFNFTVILMLALAAMSVRAQTVSADGRPGASALPLQASSDERYRIGYQDIVEVQVFRHAELNLRATVNPDGVIYLNRLDSPISAICKTERELANTIAAAYKVKYLRDPQVNVVLVEQRSQPMAVIGAVEKPGSFFVGKRINLLQLLALASGPNKESGTRMIVARTGSSSTCRMSDTTKPTSDDITLMTFRIRDIQEGKKNLWMEPGDVVSVLDADVVYVYGNVEKPGQLRVREPITLRQAIAASQGLKASSEQNVRILRQVNDSTERKELTFSLRDIEKRVIQDPYLEPNDIVAVSKDPLKSILNAIGNTIRTGIPTAITRIP